MGKVKVDGERSIVANTWDGDALCVRVFARDGKIVRLSFVAKSVADSVEFVAPDENAVILENARNQIEEYFRGARRDFDLAHAPVGTTFMQAVWREVAAIPHGEIRTYGEIADRLGTPRGAVAVGAANAANPIALIIPCHRVIGAEGKLRGYAYGLDLKRKLLEYEGAWPLRPRPSQTLRLF